jgi:hypothetical protein
MISLRFQIYVPELPRAPSGTEMGRRDGIARCLVPKPRWVSGSCRWVLCAARRPGDSIDDRPRHLRDAACGPRDPVLRVSEEPEPARGVPLKAAAVRVGLGLRAISARTISSLQLKAVVPYRRCWRCRVARFGPWRSRRRGRHRARARGRPGPRRADRYGRAGGSGAGGGSGGG